MTMIPSAEKIRSLMDNKANVRCVAVVDLNSKRKISVLDAMTDAGAASLTGGSKVEVAKEESKIIRSTERTASTATVEDGVAHHSIGSSSSSSADRQTNAPPKTTAKSTNVYPVIFEYGRAEYLLHLVGSLRREWPECVPSEVTPTLRISDGALVVVDAAAPGGGTSYSPPLVQNVVQQCVSERVRYVLMLDGVGRALHEPHPSLEGIYQAFRHTIESANSYASMYNTNREDFGGDSIQLHPAKGTVAFGSCLHGWAFTIGIFAKMYAQKFNLPEERMAPKLWGDWFYDPSEKKWTTSNEDSTKKRAFCEFILTPIHKLVEAVLMQKHKKVQKMLEAIHVELSVDENNLSGKELLFCILSKWLPIKGTILQMMVLHLPSPVKAQAYRYSHLYTGPGDVTADAIRTCDAKASAPSCMYISKMFTASGQKHFFAFGRVFSGTIATGQKVRIMGPSYIPGKKTDLWVKNIQHTIIIKGRYTEQVADVPAGNMCALVGVDQYLLHSGTIATGEDAHPIMSMKFSVPPIIRCVVEPKNSKGLPKLVEGMKLLAKSDRNVLCYTEESGEHIIAAFGGLHMAMCLQDLQNDFMDEEVKISDPFVSFRETCNAKSSQTCLAKSANKHNRLFVEAEPLGPELCKAIDDGEIKPGIEAKVLGRTLAGDYGWDLTEARRIWAFGPDGTGPNMFVETTKRVNYLLEVKESVVGGFQWATQNGPLCEEQMRGCRFNFIDLVMNSDAIHRGMGQIMPASRRACFSSMMLGEPGLLEPMYLCNISAPQDVMCNVYGVLTQRRGHVFSEEQKPGTPQMTLLAYLPVMESFGFTAALRSNTGGKAFPQNSFDHWEPMTGSPYTDGSKTQETIIAVRKRKGLTEGVPEVNKYLDKL